jgi:hypothetical protein
MTDRRIDRPVMAAVCGAILLVTASLFPTSAWSQEAPAAAESPTPASTAEPGVEGNPSEVPLSAAQEQVRRRFKRFEETLLKLSTSLRKTDPDRALMLDRARGKINQERFDQEMGDLAKLLASKPLGDSVLEREEDLIARMQALLELLQSEDRQKEIAKEKERIAGLIKEVNKLIGEQKGARQLAEGSSEKAREAQEKVAKNTNDLLKKIDGQDAEKRAEKAAEGDPKGSEKLSPEKPNGENGEPMGDEKSPDGKPMESPGGEKPQGEKPQGEKPQGDKPEDKGKPSSEKPAAGETPESKPSEGESAEAPPSESKPMDGEPSESSKGKPKKPPKGAQPQQGGQPPPSENSETPENPQGEEESSDETPGRPELEKARDEMRRAIEDLEKKAKGKAGEKQDEAVRQLIAAKEKLEEILRQLREEERGRQLAALEARFQRMLAMELKVYDGTVRLGKIAPEHREPRHREIARDLASKQDEVDLEASKTLNLLREEGSAVAFKEAVEQMREDMRLASRRLAREDAGDLTQAVEKDIIDALQEMIAAVQKEMEKQEQQKSQDGQQPGQPQEPGLLDQIAELKMLKSLQMRVNQRTRRLGDVVRGANGTPGEAASDPELLDQLRNLAERQARIQRAAYDLATGRNE